MALSPPSQTPQQCLLALFIQPTPENRDGNHFWGRVQDGSMQVPNGSLTAL
jgi:hypothetical protein